MIARNLKNIDDLLRVSETQRAHLINGEIIMMAPASAYHSIIQARITHIASIASKRILEADPKYSLEILSEAWTYYDSKNCFVHDIAAFWSDGLDLNINPIKQNPHWVCEVQSPSNWTKDAHDVLKILEKYRVKYYWLINPMLRGLTFFNFDPISERMIQIAVYSEKDGIVSLSPFEDIDLDLANLFKVK